MLFVSVDACFGLPRKKTSGASHRSPLSNNMFFYNQEHVDNFMASYPSSKNDPKKVYLPIHTYMYQQLLTVIIFVNQQTKKFLSTIDFPFHYNSRGTKLSMYILKYTAKIFIHSY